MTPAVEPIPKELTTAVISQLPRGEGDEPVLVVCHRLKADTAESGLLLLAPAKIVAAAVVDISR